MPETVFLIEETRHFEDWENRRQDESSIDIDQGVFSCREDAEQVAAELNSKFYAAYLEAEDKRKAVVLKDARDARRRNEDRAVLRQAGRRTTPDESVVEYKHRSFADWKRQQEHYYEYDVVAHEVR